MPPDQSGDDWPLSLEEYARYGRQMIMPEWGLGGQLKVKNARVTVIGAGGLGCPVLQYLVGAGVGEITIVDHDEVSASNLHRQVLHTGERVGMNKAESACIALRGINDFVRLEAVTTAFTPVNAAELLRARDLVLDCTDRPYTRYLINDAAVVSGVPLVSGAALGAAGQWAVYGGSYGEGRRRPCYRCMWPRPGASARCDEAGVWGPVTGMVGSGMAAAALQLLTGSTGPPVLHVLHMGGSPMVRTVSMRAPRADCVVCGPGASITDLSKVDYDALCAGPPATTEATDRLTVNDLRELVADDSAVVVDTRPPVEYGICSLPNTTNIPLARILASPDAVPPASPVVFLCRRGNDSQVAAAHLRAAGREATDVVGGLTAWSRDVDPSFPLY